jgi:hypothetical protein
MAAYTRRGWRNVQEEIYRQFVEDAIRAGHIQPPKKPMLHVVPAEITIQRAHLGGPTVLLRMIGGKMIQPGHRVVAQNAKLQWHRFTVLRIERQTDKETHVIMESTDEP